MGEKKDWYSVSEELHRKYRGKLEVVPKVPIKSFEDFSIWYTPGVAEPCRRIKSGGKDLSLEYTFRWNLVAVVTDGTRVLGLGKIGPEAGLPVMEGKSLLFKYLGGVDAIPLALATTDADKFIEVVKLLEPSFGGINLEDIEQPKCFYILDKLRELLEVPVWHDDQQGTAVVNVAAVINALKIVNKKLSDVKVAIIGSGAAGIATAKYLIAAGVKAGNIYMVDTKGILHRDRPDLKTGDFAVRWKKEMAEITNSEGRSGGMAEAIKGTDVLIGLSTPGPGVIKPEWIKTMNDDPVVFPEANPIPEIWPWEAKEAGAKVVGTARSDFPNQVNNSLAFPAVFRGALTVRAKKITDGMCLAAAHAIAEFAEKEGISEDRILPTMDEIELYVYEAIKVAEKAMEEGVARKSMNRTELEEEIRELITRPKKYLKVASENLLIK
ncbi:MAG: NADP-dependent malic enzyme [Sulfolobales archaeon]